MKKTFFIGTLFFINIILFSSCVSYSNHINVYSQQQPTAIVYHDSIINLNKEKERLNLGNGHENRILIKTANDSITIAPKLKKTEAFLTCGVMRKHYYNDVYIDSTNHLYYRYKYRDQMHRKGNIDLYLSVPYINNFVLRPFGNNKPSSSSTNYFGANVGVGYFYNKNC